MYFISKNCTIKTQATRAKISPIILTVTSRTTHLGKTLFISCNYNDLFLTHARTVAYLHLCDNKTK